MMKNIHILPTDKPSRLWTNNLRRRLELDEFPSQHPTNIVKHIYITSDEEIKEGDWHLYENEAKKTTKETLDYIDSSGDEGFKKIILTTDQDLIKDGVQAIDDNFLEWFVKNPSCKEVELKYELGSCLNCEWNHDMCPNAEECLKNTYKIIIPKEEQKQHLINIMKADEELGLYEEPKQENCCTPIGQIKRYVDCYGCDRKPKQETLEEAAERYIAEDNYNRYYNDFIEGAKWQAERMYSEEDMIEFGFSTYCYISELMGVPFNLMSENKLHAMYNFEQFKKK